MSITILDGRRMKNRETAHDYLKKMLLLPDYYGRNLDALYDCLCEAKKILIILTYVQEMKDNLGRYAEDVIRVIEAAEEKNPNISFIIEQLVDEL